MIYSQYWPMTEWDQNKLSIKHNKVCVVLIWKFTEWIQIHIIKIDNTVCLLKLLVNYCMNSKPTP